MVPGTRRQSCRRSEGRCGLHDDRESWLWAWAELGRRDTLSLPPSGPPADVTNRLSSLFLLSLSEGLRRVSAQGPSQHRPLALVRLSSLVLGKG